MVPEGVEFINAVVVFEGDEVAAFVTVGVVSGVEVFVVEGLVHIANVVDEEAECV